MRLCGLSPKHRSLKIIFTGFISGVLLTSILLLIIGLVAFGIETIIRKLYHPSTHLWWFIIGSVFILVVGGFGGILISLARSIFLRKER